MMICAAGFRTSRSGLRQSRTSGPRSCRVSGSDRRSDRRLCPVTVPFSARRSTWPRRDEQSLDGGRPGGHDRWGRSGTPAAGKLPSWAARPSSLPRRAAWRRRSQHVDAFRSRDLLYCAAHGRERPRRLVQHLLERFQLGLQGASGVDRRGRTGMVAGPRARGVGGRPGAAGGAHPAHAPRLRKRGRTPQLIRSRTPAIELGLSERGPNADDRRRL